MREASEKEAMANISITKALPDLKDFIRR